MSTVQSMKQTTGLAQLYYSTVVPPVCLSPSTICGLQLAAKTALFWHRQHGAVSTRQSYILLTLGTILVWLQTMLETLAVLVLK